jgi:hypothetical protein
MEFSTFERRCPTLEGRIKAAYAATLRGERSWQARGQKPSAPQTLVIEFMRAFRREGGVDADVLRPFVEAAYYGLKVDTLRRVVEDMAERQRRERLARCFGF